jgi:hypothetical protein
VTTIHSESPTHRLWAEAICVLLRITP